MGPPIAHALRQIVGAGGQGVNGDYVSLRRVPSMLGAAMWISRDGFPCLRWGDNSVGLHCRRLCKVIGTVLMGGTAHQLPDDSHCG